MASQSAGGRYLLDDGAGVAEPVDAEAPAMLGAKARVGSNPTTRTLALDPRHGASHTALALRVLGSGKGVTDSVAPLVFS